jgi:hypothetical protein
MVVMLVGRGVLRLSPKSFAVIVFDDWLQHHPMLLVVKAARL